MGLGAFKFVCYQNDMCSFEIKIDLSFGGSLLRF